MDVPLATYQDAVAFGLTVTEESLARASARVRSHLGQRLTAETSTITARGPSVMLPERPVTAVSAVVDADGVALTAADDGWTLVGDVLTVPGRADVLTITYAHGQPLTDPQLEAVCTIAARLAAVSADPVAATAAAGVQQQGAGPFSMTYGFDSYKALSGLTSGERESLDAAWPSSPRKRPRLIVMGG